MQRAKSMRGNQKRNWFDTLRTCAKICTGFTRNAANAYMARKNASVI